MAANWNDDSYLRYLRNSTLSIQGQVVHVPIERTPHEYFNHCSDLQKRDLIRIAFLKMSRTDLVLVLGDYDVWNVFGDLLAEILEMEATETDYPHLYELVKEFKKTLEAIHIGDKLAKSNGNDI